MGLPGFEPGLFGPKPNVIVAPHCASKLHYSPIKLLLFNMVF